MKKLAGCVLGVVFPVVLLFASSTALADVGSSQMEGVRIEVFGGGSHIFGEDRSPRGGVILNAGYGFDFGLVVEAEGGMWMGWYTPSDTYLSGGGTFLYPLLFGARYRFLKDWIHPYLGANLGAVFAKQHGYSLDADSSASAKSKTGFGAQLKAGVELMLMDNFFMDFAIGYLVSVNNVFSASTSTSGYTTDYDDSFGTGHALFFGVGLGANIPAAAK